MVSLIQDAPHEGEAHRPVEFELGDYVHILKYRRKYFIVVALIIFICAFAFALKWSNYRATATVEVAPPDVSTATTLTTGISASESNEAMADQRISRLQQKVLSISSLAEIISKFDLYTDTRKFTPIVEIADKMRGKIGLRLLSSTLANPGASRGQAAIAFMLSFDYKNPVLAQRVTNELVSRFLDEDLKARRKEAQETSDFLATQIKALETTLEEQEKKIAEFRAANADISPESLAFNMQAVQSTSLSMQNLDAQITAGEGTLGSLRGQLAALDPYSRVIADGQVLTTPSVQLKALKSQYASLSTQYGQDHPDVVKIRHQIEALQKHVGKSSNFSIDSDELQAKLADARTNLIAAQKTYAADHPDVVSLKRQVAKLEKEAANHENNTYALNGIKQDADNPAYLQVVAQLRSSEEQRKSLQQQKKTLEAQMEKYQHGVAQNPAAQQKLAILTRDYDNAQLRYRELKEKKMAADMSAAIEEDRTGQRLVVIDPPELPLHTQPARALFLIGGIALAIAGGLAAVIVAQLISGSVVGPRYMTALTGAHPLVTIPYLFTETEKSSIGNRRIKFVGLIALGAIIALFIFSRLVIPLDVLWTIIMRQLGFV